ncbi:TPA: ribonuclease III [Candidatus Poribacteria bacterium]|nr:ribonuclease III [Candidatus Poribacteria bacterium]
MDEFGERITELELKLGYRFHDPELLRLAITHRSFAPKCGKHNERLEFLGDAVLGMVVSSYLYEAFEEYSEGELSKLRSALVNHKTLAKCAKELGLHSYMRLGRSELREGCAERHSILASTFEAIVGAIYLDGGPSKAKEFVLKTVIRHMWQTGLDRDRIRNDFKSALQVKWQSLAKMPPVYRVVSESGPDHDKSFEVEVYLANIPYGRGVGKSKKEAEQNAARQALEALQAEESEDVQGEKV